MKYFKHPYTAEGAAQTYKDLAKVLHPDKGGDKEEFQRLTREYELVKKVVGVVGSTRPGSAQRTGTTRPRRARAPRQQMNPDALVNLFKQIVQTTREMNDELDRIKKRKRK